MIWLTRKWRNRDCGKHKAVERLRAIVIEEKIRASVGRTIATYADEIGCWSIRQRKTPLTGGT